MKRSSILKTKRGNIWPGLLIAIMMFLFAMVSEAMAQSPNLVNIGVSTKGNLITMHARLVGGMTDSIVEAIESGVPISFTYSIELRSNNTILADSLLSKNTVRHTVQYDSLKKVYRFSAKGKNVKRRLMTRHNSKYQKLMLTLEDIPIGTVNRLDPEETYYIRVKADLETDRFWFPFNYLFFFVPFSDFKTSWVESSPLSIDPDLVLSKEASTSLKNKKNDPEVPNHVIRSFNK